MDKYFCTECNEPKDTRRDCEALHYVGSSICPDCGSCMWTRARDFDALRAWLGASDEVEQLRERIAELEALLEALLKMQENELHKCEAFWKAQKTTRELPPMPERKMT